MDVLAFEFVGLLIIALCIIVLAVPSGRASGTKGRVRQD
jgi:hypothetical protein